jgi:hypothetical protein
METFSGEAGATLANQTFTIGVIGGCTGNITIMPTATISGGTWLTFSPASAVVTSGGTATFTVGVTSAGLAAGTYNGTLSLAALNGGRTIPGSPQTVAVSLTVLSPPALAATPATLTFTQATGSKTQAIKMTNSGGSPLNWTAALASGAPAYVTISSAASGTLAAGATQTIKITVDTTGLTGGTTVTTGVTISATDPATGAAVAGSPANVSISIAPASPAMRLSATTLTFATLAGTTPAPQTVTLTNTGGNGLTWTVGTPSQTWLTVTPVSGSDGAGASTPLTFTVTPTGLLPGLYSAAVTITPSSGVAQTVTVNLTVS